MNAAIPTGAAKMPTRAEWSATLRETTIEVFATMVGVAVDVPSSDEVPVISQITGMVGIAGPVCATFSLRCSKLCATVIASHMLGGSEVEAASQKCDAVGEICNIVAGYFKAKIGFGDKCMLSVPTVLQGNDYQIRIRSGDVRLEFPVLCKDEPVWIALDIRP